MPRQKFVLTIAPDADVNAIRQDCEKLGLDEVQILSNAGVIIGTGHPSVADALQRVNGVNSVEPERQISIAPPDSDIQ
jgi:hypothetical protein